MGLVIAAALAILVGYFGISQSRPVLGLITILPIAVTLSWLLGAMWVFGISYNMGTALMVVLTIGIGVDYTIHLTHRFLEEEKESALVVDAVRQAMVTTGGALLASALTTALGLLVLVFSPLTPMQELGILAAVTILLGLIATFIVLPPLLAALGPLPPLALPRSRPREQLKRGAARAESAVDVDDLASHIAGIIGGQEAHHVGDVFGSPGPAQWHGPSPLLALLALVVGLGALGLDHPRSDGVGSRMPRGASSRAVCLVKLSTAALDGG